MQLFKLLTAFFILETCFFGACLGSAHVANTSEALFNAIELVKPGVLEFRLTTTAKPFIFSGCGNGCGCDICWQVSTRGYFAAVETMIFDWLLGSGVCGTGEIVVDVGANAGYFTNVAASHGCSVLAFEPNALPASLLKLTSSMNGFSHQVHVLPFALGRSASQGTLQKNANSASWGLHSVNPDEPTSDAVGQKLQIRPLTEFVRHNVSILKIDTEGFENNVLAGSWGVFKTHTIRNVIIEVKNFYTKEKREMLSELMRAARLPYAYNYPEDYKTEEPLGTMTMAQKFVDVSDTIANERFDDPLQWEDFWFREEPLPQEMLKDIAN